MRSLIIIVLSVAGISYANKPMVVATGQKNSTYSQMFKNVGEICSGTAYLREKGTEGTPENINLLLDKKVDLAFMQVDALKERQDISNDLRVKQIKVLIPLHKEEVHWIVGENDRNPNLANRKVAVWGDSVTTAKMINFKGRLNLEIKKVNRREEAIDQLRRGKVDSILAAVGQPAQWVSELQGFKLMGIPFYNGLEEYYEKSTVGYQNLSDRQLKTVAVRSVLATRNFRSSNKRLPLIKYRKCIEEKLIKLQEEEDNHPKWNDVNLNFYPWSKFE